MQVSAVGGLGAGAAGGVGGAATAAGGAAGAAAGANAGAAPSGSLTGTALQGTVPAGLEALSEVAQDLGGANLLFTLLILALLDKGDKEGGGAAGAISFLAGLSLAAQLGQSLGNQLGQAIEPTSGGGGLGGQIDVAG